MSACGLQSCRRLLSGRTSHNVVVRPNMHSSNLSKTCAFHTCFLGHALCRFTGHTSCPSILPVRSLCPGTACESHSRPHRRLPSEGRAQLQFPPLARTPKAALDDPLVGARPPRQPDHPVIPDFVEAARWAQMQAICTPFAEVLRWMKVRCHERCRHTRATSGFLLKRHAIWKCEPVDASGTGSARFSAGVLTRESGAKVPKLKKPGACHS